MDPFLVIVRAEDRFPRSDIDRRISGGSWRGRLLAIDNEPEESCLKGRHHVVQLCVVIASI